MVYESIGFVSDLSKTNDKKSLSISSSMSLKDISSFSKNPFVVIVDPLFIACTQKDISVLHNTVIGECSFYVSAIENYHPKIGLDDYLSFEDDSVFGGFYLNPVAVEVLSFASTALKSKLVNFIVSESSVLSSGLGSRVVASDVVVSESLSFIGGPEL